MSKLYPIEGRVRSLSSGGEIVVVQFEPVNIDNASLQANEVLMSRIKARNLRWCPASQSPVRTGFGNEELNGIRDCRAVRGDLRLERRDERRHVDLRQAEELSRCG